MIVNKIIRAPNPLAQELGSRLIWVFVANLTGSANGLLQVMNAMTIIKIMKVNAMWFRNATSGNSQSNTP